MEIQKIGGLSVVMKNEYSLHGYFGWPSVARIGNKIAVTASGYRLAHVCPFGKAVMCFSFDNGQTYTNPTPVIDTVLDERDTGIAVKGNTVVVTSFNNATVFQRNWHDLGKYKSYRLAYLDGITPEQEKQALGSLYRFSYDGGITFGAIHKSPITSPHGPLFSKDGRLLWVGRNFDPLDNTFKEGENFISVYEILPDETMKKIGEIENIVIPGKGLVASCEPCVVELDDGKLICHIRVQQRGDMPYFLTIYQTESEDGGKTWTTPHALISEKDGAPSHLIKHSSGVLLATYGRRIPPYGICVMASTDGGKTWDTNNALYNEGSNGDLGYPCTVELDDGSLLTVFYAHYPDSDSQSVILQQRWRFTL